METSYDFFVHGPAKLYGMKLSCFGTPCDRVVDWSLYRDNNEKPLYRVAVNARNPRKVDLDLIVVPTGHFLKLVPTEKNVYVRDAVCEMFYERI